MSVVFFHAICLLLCVCMRVFVIAPRHRLKNGNKIVANIIRTLHSVSLSAHHILFLSLISVILVHHLATNLHLTFIMKSVFLCRTDECADSRIHFARFRQNMNNPTLTMSTVHTTYYIYIYRWCFFYHQFFWNTIHNIS